MIYPSLINEPVHSLHICATPNTPKSSVYPYRGFSVWAIFERERSIYRRSSVNRDGFCIPPVGLYGILEKGWSSVDQCCNSPWLSMVQSKNDRRVPARKWCILWSHARMMNSSRDCNIILSCCFWNKIYILSTPKSLFVISWKNYIIWQTKIYENNLDTSYHLEDPRN